MSFARKSEIAQRYRTSTRSVEQWMKNRGMPYRKIGRQVRFEIEECDRWFEQFSKN
ncbi:MAG: helix-turn-helix domain-containing protein [Verrucomicrobiota bacterium]|jgi:excisionase family DNA binding protein